MISDLIIDEAGTEEAAALAAILTGWIRGTPWMPELHSQAATVGFLKHLINGSTVLVARQDGEPVGFLVRQGEDIPAFYIAKDARGRGIGKALLDEAKSRTSILSLWTFQANEGARRFYIREGFREVEMTDGARNEENLPDVRCVWRRAEAARG